MKRIQKISNYRVDYAMENPSNPVETEWIEKDTFLSALSEYDINGNIIKTVSYNYTGDINQHFQYKYDERNNLTAEISFYNEDEVAEQRLFLYDESNKQIEEKIVYQEGGENLMKLFYDESGNLIKRQQTDIDGEIEEIEIMEYEGNRLMRTVLYDEENKETSRKEYVYDEKGNVTNVSFSSSDKDENFVIEYYFDEKGFREKTLKFNSEKQLIEKSIFTNDENGNPVEIYEEDRNAIKKTRITYDDNKKAIKQEEFNKDDELLVNIDRTYDDEGKIMESLVYYQNPDDNIRQMYASKYEYEFYEET